MKVIKSDSSNLQIEVAGKKFTVKEAVGARGELGLKIEVVGARYVLIATWISASNIVLTQEETTERFK